MTPKWKLYLVTVTLTIQSTSHHSLKLKKELKNRLLDLKRQNKIDELTYRKLRPTDGSPPAIRGSTNRASLFDQLFHPLAPRFIIHPSSFLIFYRRSRALMDVLFLIPRSSRKKWLIHVLKSQKTRL